MYKILLFCFMWKNYKYEKLLNLSDRLIVSLYFLQWKTNLINYRKKKQFQRAFERNGNKIINKFNLYFLCTLTLRKICPSDLLIKKQTLRHFRCFHWLDWFIHIFKYITQRRLWDGLLLTLEEITTSHSEFLKKLKNLSNVRLTEKSNLEQTPLLPHKFLGR